MAENGQFHMEGIPQDIAIVYDRVNKWGGAERVLLALHQLFPAAHLYTSVYDPGRAGWARVFPKIIPSFLQRLPFISSHHEFVPFLTPIAFESFDLSAYKIVISVTSADAKSVITDPRTLHLCYCLTPTRYLWSHHQQYRQQLGPILEFLSRPSFKYLKYWDRIAAARPDCYVSISQTVKDRIHTYYGQKSTVVYPPVDLSRFRNLRPGVVDAGYFLYVSRLVPYKRADVVIRAFNRVGLPLYVVGSGNISWGIGSFESHLKNIAGSNIRFLGQVSEKELLDLYQNCRAVVFFNEEDFGIVPVEAQAAGKPVIGLNSGGLTETVANGKTGILLDDDSDTALSEAISKFDEKAFDEVLVRRQAEKFSLERFNREFVKVVATKWQEHNRIYTS